MAQQIQDIMTKHLHTVAETTPLVEVARLMRDERVGVVLVTQADGSLCGIVTDRELMRDHACVACRS